MEAALIQGQHGVDKGVDDGTLPVPGERIRLDYGEPVAEGRAQVTAGGDDGPETQAGPLLQGVAPLVLDAHRARHRVPHLAIEPLQGEAGIAHQLLAAAGVPVDLGADADELAGEGGQDPEQQDHHHQLHQGEPSR